MSDYVLSAFADEYSELLSGQIKGLKNNGIKFIELRGVNGKNISLLTEDEMLAIKEILEKENIRVSAIGSPTGKIGINEPFEQHQKMFQNILRAAEIFNANLIRVFSFYIPKNENPINYRSEVFNRMEYLINTASKKGFVLCHENEAHIYGDSPERCLDLVSNFGGLLKCVFDMGNFILGGWDAYPYAYEMLKNYIGYFHIKDAKKDGIITLPGSGEGKIKEILKDFKKHGKNTFISLEPHLTVFSGLKSLNSDVKTGVFFDSAEKAFNTAASKLKEILKEI